MNKITFKNRTKITTGLARQVTIAAPHVTLTEIDPAKLQWLDNPTAQTLSAVYPGFTVVIMGGAAKTPYNPAWTEAEAEAAFQTWRAAAMPPAPATTPATPLIGAPLGATTTTTSTTPAIK